MTDDQILEIATLLWQQKQGADFTMERLVEATGISRATLYRRFGSREAILQRLANEQALDVQELSRPDIPTRIVEATRAALNRHGFANTTVELIAQEAGVGPATIYRHFGSKEALIEAFAQANSPRYLLRTFTASPQSDLEADLTLLATTMLEFVGENYGLIQLILVDSRQGGETLLEPIRTAQGRTVTMLASYFKDHMALGNLKQNDPFALALSFVGMLLGLALVGPHAYDHPMSDITATARLVVHTFLFGATETEPRLNKMELPQ
jgi:AcrR family transcriptional regulator